MKHFTGPGKVEIRALIDPALILRSGGWATCGD